MVRLKKSVEVKTLFKLLGSYSHNLDSKFRLFVPARFREALGESFIIRVKPAAHPHIDIFTEAEFEKQIERETASASDELMRERLLFAAMSNATPVTVDSQGRITINQTILKFSKIAKTGLFVGMGTHVQIWDPDEYDKYFNAIHEDSIVEDKALSGEIQKRSEYRTEGRFIELKN